MARERLVTMDGVRGLAALSVMLFHYTRKTSHFFPMGYIEVDLFFCLSGFVVAHAYEARLDAGWSAAQFARARLIRLYPVYAVGLSLGLLHYALSALLTGTPNSALSTLRAIASSILLIPTLTPFQTGAPGSTTLNLVFPFDNPAWSLSLELAANALFFLYRPKGRALVVTCALLTVIGAVCAVEASGDGGSGQLMYAAGVPRVLFGFFAGLALYRLWMAGGMNGLPRAPLVPLALVLLIGWSPATVPSLLVMTMVVAPWAIALAVHDPASARMRAVFGWLGEASYPLYLVHYPLLGLTALAWDEGFGLPLDTPLPTVAALPLAVGVFGLSLGLARVYELPVRRWLSAQRPGLTTRSAPYAA